MIVLSRYAQESIVITVPPSTEAREVRVMVTQIRGDKSRLGITADRDITVDREEVHEIREAEANDARKAS